MEEACALVRSKGGLLNPITEQFSDRATLETATPAHKPADSDARVGNGARCRRGIGFCLQALRYRLSFSRASSLLQEWVKSGLLSRRG